MQYNIKPYAFALMQRMNAFLRAEACTVEVYRWSQNDALWFLLLFVFCSCRNGIKVCSSSISLNPIIRIFPSICFQSGRWWGQRSRLREGSSKPPTHCHLMTQSRTSQLSPQPDLRPDWDVVSLVPVYSDLKFHSLLFSFLIGPPTNRETTFSDAKLIVFSSNNTDGNY